MSAHCFASPQLIAAARDCADALARVPRVVQPADAPRPRCKGVWKQHKPRARKPAAPIDARLMQAAIYFLSRRPEYTRAERVRFGRAHGFSVAAFRRAVRAARENQQQGASEAGRSHTPSREGSTPSPAPTLAPNLGALTGESRMRDRKETTVGGSNTLRGERLECRGQMQVWDAADAGSRAKSLSRVGLTVAGECALAGAQSYGPARDIFPDGINTSARDEHALVQPNDAQAQTCENDADAGCRLGAVALAVRR